MRGPLQSFTHLYMDFDFRFWGLCKNLGITQAPQNGHVALPRHLDGFCQQDPNRSPPKKELYHGYEHRQDQQLR